MDEIRTDIKIEMPEPKLDVPEPLTLEPSQDEKSEAPADFKPVTVELPEFNLASDNSAEKPSEPPIINLPEFADEPAEEPVRAATPAYETWNSSSQNRKPYMNYKAKKEPKYVTRKAFIITLIIAMIITSFVGALFGAAIAELGMESSGTASSDDFIGENSRLSLADGTGSELEISQIVDRNADAVVEILVTGTVQNYFGQTELVEGAGSGVIVTADGYIVTNFHVIQGATKVTVKLHNGEAYQATIIGSDPDRDIAVIRIPAENLVTATIGDSSKVKVGDIAVAIGNPLGQLGGTATTGIVSALDRTLEIDGRTLTLMQTDAAINRGNSGGGLFDGSGDLIGIVDAKSAGEGIEGLAFAIPINSVKETINDLITTGKVAGKPVIGVMIQDVSEENAAYYGLDSPGVYVSQVTGNNAQIAGFQPGDRIVSINGKAIATSSELITTVREYSIGETITVVVSRDGQEIEIKTVLEESMPSE